MLKGEKITLRPLKITDWEKTIQWRNDIVLKGLAIMHPFPITEMVEKQWYEDILRSKSTKVIYFTIIADNDIPVGFITLNDISYINKNCYLGIVIGDQKEQAKGYGIDTMNTIIKYAFNTLNLIKITVEVAAINGPALSLYKKLGFVEEGRLKNHYYNNGNYIDILIMSLFKNGT
jgi:diamine N-acetyltransferase